MPTEDRRSLETLISILIGTEKELVAALEQYLEVGPDGEHAVEIEEHSAGLLAKLLEQREGVVAEAERQAVPPDHAREIYARLRRQRGEAEFRFWPKSEGAAAPIPSASPWQRAAEAGRPAAQFVLGQILLGYLGDSVDPAAGVVWVRRAAEQDYGPALVTLSGLRFSGQGVPRDEQRGSVLLRRAAELGVAQAQFQLGVLCGGRPTERGGDIAETVSWLEKAAQAGHAEAQLALGMIHAWGHTGRVDHAAAVKWMSLAAEQHRQAAIEWLAKYGGMAPEKYEDTVYLENWSPEQMPPARRSSCLEMLIATGFLGLLIGATVKGNSLGIVFLVLFLAVLSHEVGHLWAARLVGIPILVFSIGVGPVLRSFCRRGKRFVTRYDVHLVPLLGSVRPYSVPRDIWDYWQACFRAQEQGEPAPAVPIFDKSQTPQSVTRYVSRPRRLFYSLGGLAANFCLALVCTWVYENCSATGRLITAPLAGRIPQGSVAEKAGLREGDRMLSVAGEEVKGFFDMQRRLAPVNGSGRGLATKYPAGANVELKVSRGEQELLLQWPTPQQPPAENAETVYGLFPPETWRVDRVHKSAAGTLQPGDVIQAFDDSGHRITSDAQDAHTLLYRAFATAGNTPVSVVIKRGASTLSLPLRRVPAVADKGDRSPRRSESVVPFELARLRVPGPPRSVAEIVSRIGQFGVHVITELPQDTVRAVCEKPTEEDKGRLLQEVRKDPWSIVRTLALMNAILLFFNLLPIPPLDGYHALCMLIEIGIRRDLPQRGQRFVLWAGWLLILGWLGLQIFLIVRDLLGTMF